jgi:hypothetical protein
MKIIDDTVNAMRVLVDSIKLIYPKNNIKDSSELIQLCLKNHNYHVFSHAFTTLEFSCSMKVIQELYRFGFQLTTKIHLSEDQSENLEFVVPDEVAENEEMMIIFTNYTKNINKVVRQLMRINNTIDLVYVLPGCIKTDVRMTVSFLNLLKLLRLSCINGYSNELKKLLDIIYKSLNYKYPLVFNKNNLKIKIEETKKEI